MSSEKELEIVRIGKQLEKLANSQTPVRAHWEGREWLECSKTTLPPVSCLCRDTQLLCQLIRLRIPLVNQYYASRGGRVDTP